MAKIEDSTFLRSQERIPLQNAVPLPSPLILLIEPTNLCNLKCKFCPTSDEALLQKVGRPKGTMPFELFKKIIDDCKSFNKEDGSPGINAIYPHKDGEPLLCKDIFRMIRYAKDANVGKEIRLITNGLLFSPENNQKLVDSGVDWIRVSVNAVSGEGYDALCGKKIDYRKFVDNFSDLFRRKKDGKPFIIAKMIDVNRTEEEKKKFYADFAGISDVCSIEEVGKWSTTYDRDFALGVQNASCNGNQRRFRHVCPLPFYSLAVNFSGKVSICCYDWAQQTVVGDLNQKSISEIWHGEKMAEFRLMHLHHQRSCLPACGECNSIAIQPDYIDGFEDQMIAAIEKQFQHGEK